MSRTMVVIAGKTLFGAEYEMTAVPNQVFQRLFVAKDYEEVKAMCPGAKNIVIIQEDISMAIPTDYIPGYKKGIR